GDLPRGVVLFLIVHGEGEEVEARLGLLGGDYRGEHGGVAVAGDYRAVRLTGDLARLKRQRAAAPLDLDGFDIEHGITFSSERNRRQAMSKTAGRSMQKAARRRFPTAVHE